MNMVQKKWVSAGRRNCTHSQWFEDSCEESVFRARHRTALWHRLATTFGLTPCNFFLWRHLKIWVYQHRTHNLEAMKEVITQEVAVCPATQRPSMWYFSLTIFENKWPYDLSQPKATPLCNYLRIHPFFINFIRVSQAPNPKILLIDVSVKIGNDSLHYRWFFRQNCWRRCEIDVLLFSVEHPFLFGDILP